MSPSFPPSIPEGEERVGGNIVRNWTSVVRR